MMLQLPEDANAQYAADTGERPLSVVLANEDSTAAVLNNDNINVSNPNSNMLYYIQDQQQMSLLEDENDPELQNFAEMLLMAPNTQQLVASAQSQRQGQQQTQRRAPHYQDVKPFVQEHEWIRANLNSTVVNQTLSSNPGDYGFRVFFDAHEKVTKNMTWTYSGEVGRLYVMLNSQCPFKVGTMHPPPDNSYIVVVPVYKDAVSRSENVVRCPHHCRNLDASGLKGKFWMNSPHPQSLYHEDIQNSNRHCLVVPFEKPHTGCQSYTYLFEFMCRNTCVGGVNRRATEVVFLLQHQGKELARAVVEVKVCACPGRDRRTDETTLAKRLSMESSGATARAGHRSSGQHSMAISGHTRLRSAPGAGSESASISILNSTDNEHETGQDGEVFSIRVRGRTNFEILKRVAEGLELRAQHQRVKKRKVSGAIDQQRVQLQQQQNLTATEVKREGEIVYSDG